MYGGIARRGRATATLLQRFIPSHVYGHGGEKDIIGARGVRWTPVVHGQSTRTTNVEPTTSDTGRESSQVHVLRVNL